MTMPCPLVGRTKLSHRIRYFFILSFVAAHVTCWNSEWGYRGFLWTKGTPKYISRNRAAVVNISREQGNKPNFGGSESGNLETAFSLHRGNTAWPPRLFQLPVIIASNYTCSKSNFIRRFLPWDDARWSPNKSL